MTPAAAWLESPEGDRWREQHIWPADDDGTVFASAGAAPRLADLPVPPFGGGAVVDPRHDPCGRLP